MKKSFEKKECLYPMPVFIIATYDKNEAPDAMVAAWGCIGDTGEVFLCIDPSHKTSSNLILNKAFSLSIGTKKYVKECDYLGIASANKITDKIKKAGFHIVKSDKINAPIIEEFPLTLLCSVKTYDALSGKLFASIEEVLADDSILTSNNKIDVDKLSPITFDPVNHTYIELGKVVGKAFSDGKELV